MMNMQARNQYLFTLISKKGGYHLRSKKEKTQLLDEYCRTTGQHRKWVIAKIRSGGYVKSMRKEKGEEHRRRRRSIYDREVIAFLIRLWEIFDRPCGKRLASMIRTELGRLRRFGELIITDEMAVKLQRISPRTIDEKLKTHKEKERLRMKYAPKMHPLLYQKIPVKLSVDQGRGIGESIQIDLVEHCGQSAEGTFLSTLSITDIGSGWWEGETVMGKSAWNIEQGLGRIQYRFPFPWREIHTDNGSEFINETVWRYTQRNNFLFSRSRPYAKNDNCFVEQKNSTHVRKIIGYRRYDSLAEQEALRELYRQELRLYKNFFQPIIPLLSKERIGGHICRRYGTPKTPYQRLMESPEVLAATKEQLAELYQSLNPADLKRKIEEKQHFLYQLSLKKQQRKTTFSKVEYLKKLTPYSVRFFTAEPIGVSVR